MANTMEQMNAEQISIFSLSSGHFIFIKPWAADVHYFYLTTTKRKIQATIWSRYSWQQRSNNATIQAGLYLASATPYGLSGCRGPPGTPLARMLVYFLRFLY
jgi:hypothetical protein